MRPSTPFWMRSARWPHDRRRSQTSQVRSRAQPISLRSARRRSPTQPQGRVDRLVRKDAAWGREDIGVASDVAGASTLATPRRWSTRGPRSDTARDGMNDRGLTQRRKRLEREVLSCDWVIRYRISWTIQIVHDGQGVRGSSPLRPTRKALVRANLWHRWRPRHHPAGAAPPLPVTPAANSGGPSAHRQQPEADS